jgi:hypothetical protein
MITAAAIRLFGRGCHFQLTQPSQPFFNWIDNAVSFSFA